MEKKIWTYETLAQTSRANLENVLRTGTAPDLEQLNGYIYCGWNHEWIGKLSGEKFKKGFLKKDGTVFGYNEMCEQDGDKYKGKWIVRTIEGKPIQLAFFRTSYMKDEPPLKVYAPYRRLAHFNYDLPFNTWYNIPFRVIRDVVVAPNEGDNTLLLCKAYLQVFPWLNILYCYFLLGMREKIVYPPPQYT